MAIKIKDMKKSDIVKLFGIEGDKNMRRMDFIKICNDLVLLKYKKGLSDDAYDEQNKIVKVEFNYDKNGSIIGVKQNDECERIFKYSNDRIEEDIVKNKLYELFIYDKNGNKICHVNDYGYEKYYEYDENNRLIKIDTEDDVISYEYDDNGNCIHMKTSDGDEVIKKYDENNKLIHYRDSNDYEIFYEYDKEDRLTIMKDNKDKIIREYIYGYNGHYTVKIDEGLATFDNNDNILLEIKFENGTCKFYEYDENGKLICEKYNKDDNLKYFYDTVSLEEARKKIKYLDINEKKLNIDRIELVTKISEFHNKYNYTYKEDSVIIKDADGYIFEFDKDTSNLIYSKIGNIMNKYEYDSKGNLIKVEEKYYD